jgi:flagellar hook assembly protein FlgD
MRTRQTVQTRSSRQTQSRSTRATSLLMLLAAGAIIVALVVLFPMEWVQVPSVTMAAERQAFSPNGDGNLDEVVLIYGLSQDASVNVQVLDAGQQVIRSLAEGEPQTTGQHSVLWDGRSDQGAVVIDGEYMVRVDAKSTARSAAKSMPVIVDNTAPVVRLANLPDDLKVGDEELLIEGTTEPDSTIWLNEQAQPLTVGPGGGFSLHYRLREGANRIELTAVDPSGNTSSVTRDVTLVLRPPEIVLDNPPDGLWIKQRMLSVQGRAAPDARLLVDGKEVAVDDNGRFNVDVLLEEGENTVRVEATDPVGNETTVERRVFLKLQPPPISLSTVQEGIGVHEPSLLVAGQTEAGATVRVNGQEVAVDTQGGFQSVVNLVDGVNLIRVEAIDRAGNASVTSRSVTYTTTTPQPSGTTLRTALMAGGAGAALVFALWILLGGLYGPNALGLSTDQPFLSSSPFEGQNLRFRLDLARPAQVMVQVWDNADKLVTILLHRRRQHAGLHTLEWDGLDDHGRVVPDDIYEVEATASTIFTTVTNRMTVIKTSERVPQLLVQRGVEVSQEAEGQLSQSVGLE